MHKTEPSIVVIGGGTGPVSVLSALKDASVAVTALVGMADSGGSTGMLRDELGVLPPGDVRKALVALARAPQMRDLFTYRFDSGSLAGHSFGNLFLTAVEKMSDNFVEAVELASSLLNIHGRVLPITLDKVTLVLKEQNGHIIRGEAALDKDIRFSTPRPAVRLEPVAHITPEAAVAIAKADAILIAPGSLYGSLAAVLVVDGVAEALSTTQAPKIFVCNLVTEQGQTDDFAVHDFADEIERFLDHKVKLDYVLYNTHKPEHALLKRYAEEGRTWVPYHPDVLSTKHYTAIGDNFVAPPTDNHRTFIRHNGQVVANHILKIIKQG
ncbi:MAG TPA: gluconeogenesis factor YvcK family protein [Candidatus Saccharimonadales bacterium]|nr:gluconeogenesis factor YvcK family protein [Candidatus Saccharimonadales bacterium]